MEPQVHAIEWLGRRVRILDQTKLPLSESYIETGDVDVVADIRLILDDLLRDSRTGVEVIELMRAQGMLAAPGPVEQFGALLKSDGARYSRIAREANVRLD